MHKNIIAVIYNCKSNQMRRLVIHLRADCVRDKLNCTRNISKMNRKKKMYFTVGRSTETSSYAQTNFLVRREWSCRGRVAPRKEDPSGALLL